MEQQDLIDTGVADIASSLGLGADSAAPEVPEKEPEAEAAPESGAAEAAAPSAADEVKETGQEAAAAAPVARHAPKSWAKEMREQWAKLDPAVQDYLEKREGDFHKGLEQYREYHGIGKSLNEVLLPYRPMIQAAGIDDAKAVASLLSAHYRLTQGALESRRAAYEQLGRDLGFGAATGAEAEIPPHVRELMERTERLESALTKAQRADYERVKGETAKQVDAFAKDKPYFDEVSTEIVAFINAGDDLQTAYDKAIWANPSVRAKEQARLQKEAEDALKAKANKEVAAAKVATAANVKGRDTTRTPTEPKGRFLDDKAMLADLEEIKRNRATH